MSQFSWKPVEELLNTNCYLNGFVTVAPPAALGHILLGDQKNHLGITGNTGEHGTTNRNPEGKAEAQDI